jgi:tRNA dimethylallyltransferase
MQLNKLIVLVGPTAVGKTSVAIALARHFGTEIISADSRQIFRELTIGTAKPSWSELEEVPHHFINSHSIHEPYDAAEYGRDAMLLINKLFADHEYLILCGGSGLYVKAVCEGFDEIPDIPEVIRENLMIEYEQHGIKVLQDKMMTLDPEYYKEIDKQNPHRLIRALEVVEGTGKSIRSFQKKNKPEHPFSIVKIGLTLPRDVLYDRIDRRMDDMISQGLFAEAESLHAFRHINALQTVGYQEIFDFVAGKYDREEAVRLLKRNSRRYAKRQLTWFQRDSDVIWMEPHNIDGIISAIEDQPGISGGQT